MNFNEAKNEILQTLGRTDPQELAKIIDWLKNSDDLDDLLVDNQKAILMSIAEDLRPCLPLEAMFPSETMAIQKTQQTSKPTVHVDAFLYDEETVDSLCEDRKMSRNYCLNCGSHSTAPLEFISHSFSVSELRFLFHHVLPDLTGRLVMDVGSRLGTVLYGGYLYSSAARLVGVEMSEEFVKLQTMVVEKYAFGDRIQVIHADICTQAALVQNADVLIMNNVFEYFMEPKDQAKAWNFISQNFLKKGALLVTVPSIQEALISLQASNGLTEIGHWLEEVLLDYSAYLQSDTELDFLKQIHLYRVL
uniref:Zgc:109986 n=1 Tax=Astyanax mexicanus TaxID=7994 RepID=W5K5R5_ASTMX